MERDKDLAETFGRSGPTVHQISKQRSGTTTRVDLKDLSDSGLDACAAFEQSLLRSSRRPAPSERATSVRVADLFAGIGGLSLGAERAAWALGKQTKFIYASDIDERILAKYRQNFGVSIADAKPIEETIDGRIGADPTKNESELVERLGTIDLLLAGPPCQGHSDLNNHTRRDDPRNDLYLKVARFIELLRPTSFLIENVPGVVHDRSQVVQKTISHLTSCGYHVDGLTMSGTDAGVAQSRKRYFLAGSTVGSISLATRVAESKRDERPVMWAIGDLSEIPGRVFESSAKHWPVNEARMNYLFSHGIFDLPNKERPPCHRDGNHSYVGVYGRMHPDRPAPTITRGFGSTGQGRFVHPEFPRTLTPHEAARVQSFPDWFDFEDLRRGDLQKAIGNAVPPQMSYLASMELLSAESSG